MKHLCRNLHFVVPGPLEQISGGYLYDRQIIKELQNLCYHVIVHELPGTFPFVDEVAICAAKETLARLSDGEKIVIDGLALPAFVNSLERHSPRLDILALVHHPLALETGLKPKEREFLRKQEMTLLAKVKHIIVTSPYTMGELGKYNIVSEKISVVIPGTEKSQTIRSPHSGPLQLLCIANLIPRKGHKILVAALATLKDLDWRLMCIGNSERHCATLEAVQKSIKQYQLEERISLVGEKTRKQVTAAYCNADIFVLASFYEGYGMVLSEALSYGLPIVSTTGGAIPQTVSCETALLVPPGDVAELAKALRLVMTNKKLRIQLAAGARRAGERLPTWQQAGKIFAAELGTKM